MQEESGQTIKIEKGRDLDQHFIEQKIFERKKVLIKFNHEIEQSHYEEPFISSKLHIITKIEAFESKFVLLRQIKIGDVVLKTIKDSYQICQEDQQTKNDVSTNSNLQNPLIYKRKTSLIHRSKNTNIRPKRDLRNVVKNITKHFKLWIIKQKGNLEIQNQKILILQQKILKPPFNNKVILNIANNPFVNKLFYQYLTSDSEKMIEQSKIIDKKSHFDGIKQYKKIMQIALKQNENK